MLTALYNERIIHIENFSTDFLKKLSDERLLHCVDCNEPIIFRQCSGRQSHFSHFNSDCTYPFSEPESIEHETGKNALFHWISSQFNYCEVEKKIIQTNQRADTFINDYQLAVEYQCSPIQEKTWKHRVELYQSANINSIWVLGYSMHKYHGDTHIFHKMNQLESAVLKAYQKVMYYDVLTKYFVVLMPEKVSAKYVQGKEYFFKPDEVFIKDGKFVSKYDYFLSIQKNRHDFCLNEGKKEKETDDFIKNIKITVENERKLATKKQINYIKFLLHKSNKKIPYKLHGLTQNQADAIIRKLI